MGKPVRIVILQRGWVFVGRYTKLKNGERILDHAQCIRAWGTTKGLGELRNGPTPSTRLDPSGTVRFHYLTEVGTLDAEESAWQKHLS